MKEFIVFYSWQSDLPNRSNRNFIADILKRAAKTATTDSIDVVIDEALRDTTGSPKIDEVIVQKIQSCDMFVADISFVAHGFDYLENEAQRLLPNPNVLFELGIASEALKDWNRILLIANEHYGAIKQLPFDLRQHNCIPYKLDPNVEDKAEPRRNLKKKIESDLKNLIGTNGKKLDKSKPCLELKWSRDFTLTPFANMYSAIDSKINEAIEHQESLREVEEDLADLVGGRLHMVNGPSPHIVSEYNHYLTTYLNELRKFRASNNAYFLCSSRYVVNTGLAIDNTGAQGATNITFSLVLPDWLKVGLNAGGTGHLPMPPSAEHDLRTRTYSAQPRERFHTTSQPWISFNENRLEVSNYPEEAYHQRAHHIPQNFFIIALPSAPIGVHPLSVRMICSEYDDWQDSTIEIEVVGSD